MAAHSRTRFRSERSANIWPGFVDALATLLLVIVFLLSVSALAQFFLGRMLSGRDQALEHLKREIAELQTLLSLESKANTELRASTAQLSTSLQHANQSRDQALKNASQAVVSAEKLGNLLKSEKAARDRLSAKSTSEVNALSQEVTALKNELQKLSAALDAAESRDSEKQKTIRDLGNRLNRALAVKIEELTRYRSEFFGRLRALLGDRAGIAIEGDRFILQSEVLFASGSAEIGPDGRTHLKTIAETLVEIASEIPSDINWVLRVDGHTDRVPISTEEFPSNWELSAARALAVVHYLVAQNVPPERVSAAGFGQFHPRDPRQDEIGNRRNRRIEFKLTRR
ncbi:MAG: peptidoglycan -binding protein [Rhodospirillales bacterium]|nr:peptidoglycan -binding protein [Rhodospirillales bacterium]